LSLKQKCSPSQGRMPWILL